MNENYIVINGKKAELTEEQLKQLGIEPEKKRNNPFDRVGNADKYFYINALMQLHRNIESRNYADTDLYNACNYFNDEAFAKQVALHQLLYRKLLKFAYDNKCEDNKIWGNNEVKHWYILYDFEECEFCADWGSSYKKNDVYFSNKEAAERAIKEVVEPFMKEHPDFVW